MKKKNLHIKTYCVKSVCSAPFCLRTLDSENTYDSEKILGAEDNVIFLNILIKEL